MINFLSVCLCGNVIISLTFIKGSFATRLQNSYWLTVFVFSGLSIMSLPFGHMVYDRKSAVNLIVDPLCMRSCFSLAPFKIFPSSFAFTTLIVMCFGVDFFVYFS